MYNFRTDMADERRDIYKKANKIDDDIPGIKTSEKIAGNDVKLSTVDILDKNGEQAIGKPIGKYITFDFKNLKFADEVEIENLAGIISKELSNMIFEITHKYEDESSKSIQKYADDNFKKVSRNADNNSKKTSKNAGGIFKRVTEKAEVLVVGLGNRYVTPDSLGPNVVSEVEVTRHLIKYAPGCVVDGARSVSAIAPGVLGTTGIETLEIVKGIVDNINPKILIVIDSLASKSIDRISSSIQISNTGIVPGAGVGNTRKELSKKTLGIPVIAIGVPMVVDMATITDECLDLFISKLQEDAKSNDYLNSLKEQDNYDEIKSALIPNDYNMIVTPKEIDELIKNMTSIIARSINYAL